MAWSYTRTGISVARQIPPILYRFTYCLYFIVDVNYFNGEVEWVPYKECSYSNSVNIFFLEKKILFKFMDLSVLLDLFRSERWARNGSCKSRESWIRGAELHGPTSSRVFSTAGARWGPLPPHLTRSPAPLRIRRRLFLISPRVASTQLSPSPSSIPAALPSTQSRYSALHLFASGRPRTPNLNPTVEIRLMALSRSSSLHPRLICLSIGQAVLSNNVAAPP